MKQPQFPVKKLISWALYALIPLALFHLYFYPLPLQQKQQQQQQQQQQPQQQQHKVLSTRGISRSCNYTDGRWVQDHRPTIYNGTSCGTIKDGQNCMAHGRPDTGYLHWRWQPRQCKLLRFNPLTFLNLIRNKHLAFVGDSLARNQLESLLCLLSSASPAELVYRDGEDNKFRRWSFSEYQVNVSVFWSPFLVKGVEKGSANGLKNHNKLYVDVADERWASELHGFDIIVFSVGHWFLHPAIYYEEGETNVVGCHHCREENAFNYTEIGFFDVFRKAVKTSLHEVVVRKGLKLNDGKDDDGQLVVLTTFSPAHFEGEWDKAGACAKTEPYKEGERGMEYMDLQMRRIEVEEVERAKKEVEEKMMMKVKIEALDVTRMAWMRGDGHPGPYMHAFPFANGVPERVQNDCVHWCLPGPIDAWNEILLQMVKRWRDQTSKR